VWFQEYLLVIPGIKQQTRKEVRMNISERLAWAIQHLNIFFWIPFTENPYGFHFVYLTLRVKAYAGMTVYDVVEYDGHA
jgi:hypothetical protein